MPTIKPISDLRNKTNEISALVHEHDEPVYITKNGEGDMVILSIRQYTRLQTKIDLLGKLAAAQAQRAAGDNGKPLSQVMQTLRRRLKIVLYSRLEWIDKGHGVSIIPVQRNRN